MGDTLNLDSIRDTLSISGNVFIDNFNAKDTLVAVTIQKNQTSLTIWDSSTFKVLFPLLVTLVIFFLGQLLTIYFKKKDRKTQLQNSKTSLETWVLQLEENARSFARHCARFSGELSNQTQVQRVTLSYTPTLINKISELSVTEFLNYSTLNLRGDDMINATQAFNIIHHIEYMKNVETDVKKQYELFIAEVENLIDRWNAGSQDLEKVKLTMFHEVGSDGNHIAYTFSHDLNNFFNKWNAAEHDHNSVKVWDEKFITPLVDFLFKEVETNAKNPYPSVFLDKLRSLKEILLNWEMIQKGYAILIKNSGEAYQDSYNNLKREILHLRTQELVNVWRIR
jgi:hypothetical protein